MLDIIVFPFLVILRSILEIYVWMIIGYVALNWLVTFQVVNHKNNLVKMIMEFLAMTTEPLLTRIRRLLPLVGGFDLSPFVLIIILWFLEGVIGRLMIKAFMVGNG